MTQDCISSGEFSQLFVEFFRKILRQFERS